MITFTAESLKWQNINVNASEIIFENISYIKKKVLSKKFKEQAINFAKEHESSMLRSMVVEHKLYFSVWLEKAKSLTDKEQPDPISEKRKNLLDEQMIEDYKNLDSFLDQKFSELGL
ncbi:hypothetical protein Xen7305DRAFT_00001020 [Xenococcus sp. PCC 7305]|uniref:hypothetical protein n=1 Tax=Xenococcus sp. PCC 7305 TaxID=102125 RepID=UPI0002ACF0FD|nr:hypothetical protein [Xenococcus sp. PCC 7305]ELS00401.1 hypothetical protein Xen7305DRAFT_00001020 [Xenococcus sp. PCC 7305]